MAKKKGMVVGKSNRGRRILITSLISLVTLAVVGVIGLSIYVGLNLLKPDREPINKTPDSLNMEYKDFEVTSLDGKTNIEGWVIEPENPVMTVIFSHGYGKNRLQLEDVEYLNLAKKFYEQNIRVVVYDFRASGTSGGDMVTIGVKEKEDLLAVVDYIKTTTSEPIGLYGVSMGAVTSILAGAETDDVVGVVADSPFSDLKSYLEVNMPVWTGLPNFPFTPVILNTVPILAQIDMKDSSPVHAVENYNGLPLFLIHGTGDDAIPYTESEKIKDAYPEAEIWTPDVDGHVRSFQKLGDVYTDRVIEYFLGLIE